MTLTSLNTISIFGSLYYNIIEARLMKPIVIRGGCENNLKSINLDIPKERIIVFTGVSGSGKSSIVFNTIAVEAQRQLNETFPLFIKNKLPSFDPPKVDKIDNVTAVILVDQKKIVGSSRSTVGTLIDVMPLIRLLYSRCGIPSAGTATAYSFNSPIGMCSACKGIGIRINLDMDKLLDKSRSLNSGAIRFKPWAKGSWQWKLYANSGYFDINKPVCDYSDEEWYNLLHGAPRRVVVENDPTGVTYEGMADRFSRLYLNRNISDLSKNVRSAVQNTVSMITCDLCLGQRLNSTALASKIGKYNIAELCELEIDDVVLILNQYATTKISQTLSIQIQQVLNKVINMGLGYLTLDRHTSSLSGGEAQRLKLIKHLGSSLVGMTYILDEPSAGLHPNDISRIIELLQHLRDRGNSIIVVEHEPTVIESADIVIDVGPEAGSNGGNIVFQGSPKQLKKSNTETGRMLNSIPVLRSADLSNSQWIKIKNANHNNLQNISVCIPLNAMTVVTGLSGSGKSSLALNELSRQVQKAIVLDQKPVGVSSRSNLATYLGVMDLIRKVFAHHTGESAGLFSFNSEGKCPSCAGRGVIEEDMVYSDPIMVRCEECQGGRFSKKALTHFFKGKNIVQVLKMSVSDSIGFFNTPQIDHLLQVIDEVGLGYMTLGQPTSEMSGGETQRMKLADCLQANGNIYVLDEPTTGLHMADVEKLINLLQTIVAKGNTIVVIEHNQHMISACDWVIDLGPGGGRHGGQVIFEGSPAELVKCNKSITGQWLKIALNDIK